LEKKIGVTPSVATPSDTNPSDATDQSRFTLIMHFSVTCG